MASCCFWSKVPARVFGLAAAVVVALVARVVGAAAPVAGDVARVVGAVALFGVDVEVAADVVVADEADSLLFPHAAVTAARAAAIAEFFRNARRVRHSLSCTVASLGEERSVTARSEAQLSSLDILNEP